MSIVQDGTVDAYIDMPAAKVIWDALTLRYDVANADNKL
jgi:hypothetical protein